MASQRSSASPVPLIISLISLVSSAVLALLPYFKVVTNTEWYTSFFGWLLAPIATFIMVGIDFFMQNSVNNSARFNFRPGFSKTLKLIAYLSIPILILHALRLAGIWSVV